ncbi:MAG: aldose 1-epimerase family protein [Planctomycetaceae bacterium]
MAVRSFVLYDADSESPEPRMTRVDATVSGLQLNCDTGCHVSLRTLRGGLSDGVDVVDLCSGPLTVSLLPTRGMGLWKATRDGVTAGWKSPVSRPVHPKLVNLGSRNGLGWLDGFNELLCRCGLAFNGPPGIDAGAKSPIESQLTLHGKIANLPAHRVEVEVDDTGPGRISVIGVVDECTLFGPQLRLTSRVSLAAGGTTIEIEDRIENRATSPTELELLYHINVGPPFLDAGAKLWAPAKVVAPRDARAAEGIDDYTVYLGPTAGYAEQAYFFDLVADETGRTTTLVHNAAGDRGFAVSFPRQQLPCFTVWKCTQAEADGYVTGLEPGTNFPNFKSFEREQGRVVLIPPGGNYQTSMNLDLHITEDEVARAVERIRALQGRGTPQRHPNPAPGFSPVT